MSRQFLTQIKYLRCLVPEFDGDSRCRIAESIDFPVYSKFSKRNKSNILTFDYLNVHIISEQSTNKKQESSS